MLKISTNNSPTNNFKQQQFDISKRRTLVNAIDTLDLEVNNCNKNVNAAQKVYLGALSFVYSLIMVKIGENLKENNLNKLPNSKKFPLMLSATASTVLLFGLLSKKRADSKYKSNLLAQSNTEKALDNPKLFLNISEERQENINKNPIYAYYNNTQYPEEQDFFPDFKIKKHKNFMQDIKQAADNFLPTTDKHNEHLEALKQIDNKTQDYTKKITAGMNLFLGAGSLIAGGISLTLEKIMQPSRSLNKIFPLIAAIPMFYMFSKTTNEYFSKIEMISRQKAKEDFIENKNNDKNFLQTTLEYLRTKKEYEQKVLRQKDLVPLKNKILSNIEASKTEIKEAKKSQTAFLDAVKSESRIKNKKKNTLKNSISQDLIINSVTLPILYLFMKSFDNTKNKLNKSLFGSFTLLAGAYTANTGLTFLLNKDTKNK